MSFLYLDFETRWIPELSNHGVYRCASDPSAGINCISWAIDGGPMMLVPYLDYALEEDFDVSEMMAYDRGEPYAKGALTIQGNRLYQALENNIDRRPNFYAGCWKLIAQFSTLAELVAELAKPDTVVVAHNALFELMVLLLVLGIELPPERFICTMALCRYYGYPGSLEDAGIALGTALVKDPRGKDAMKKLVTCKYQPADDPLTFSVLYKYCAYDSEVCRMIHKMLPPLPEMIQELWCLDAEINLRGVPIDLVAIQHALKIRERLIAEQQARVTHLTGGKVTSATQDDKMKAFIAGLGVHMVDITADTVARVLQTDLPPLARELLELRQNSALSSLAKYQKFLDYQVGGRLYGMWNFYGAHTGRPTGEGPQVLNLARSADPEFWAAMLHDEPDLFMAFSKPGDKLKQALRGIIYSEV